MTCRGYDDDEQVRGGKVAEWGAAIHTQGSTEASILSMAYDPSVYLERNGASILKQIYSALFVSLLFLVIKSIEFPVRSRAVRLCLCLSMSPPPERCCC